MVARWLAITYIGNVHAIYPVICMDTYYCSVHVVTFYVDYRKSCGEVHIIGEEVKDCRFMVTMKLSCTGLNKKNVFGKV